MACMLKAKEPPGRTSDKCTALAGTSAAKCAQISKKNAVAGHTQCVMKTVGQQKVCKSVGENGTPERNKAMGGMLQAATSNPATVELELRVTSVKYDALIRQPAILKEFISATIRGHTD